MRSKSRTILIVALAVIATAGVICVVYLVSPHEPRYQGKTLSEWIAPFCRQTAKGLDAPGGPEHFAELQPVRQAIRQIGTNGLPFLIARVNYRESKLHRTVRQLLEKQPIAAFKLTDPNVSKIRAIRALANLGSDAKPAIPALQAQLGDAILSEHTVYALSGMEAEGMRALVDKYTNVPTAARIQIAQAIVIPTSIYRGGEVLDSTTPIQRWAIEGYSHSETTDEVLAATLLDGLYEVARDRASFFQTLAIQRLGSLGPSASNAVPILVQVLNDRNSRTLQSAIFALGKIRAQPQVVIPALSNLLSYPDLQIQLSASSALRQFGYDVPVQPGVPRVMHPPRPVQRNAERYY